MTMTARRTDELDELLRSGIEPLRIASAAIFTAAPDAAGLELAAAAGISGPPLDALVAAVVDPRHPFRRTLAERTSSYNVSPMNPGGPALRSHVLIDAHHGGSSAPIGILAVAHAEPLGSMAQETLHELADRAAAAIVGQPTRP
jgi:hypothetical protein